MDVKLLRRRSSGRLRWGFGEQTAMARIKPVKLQRDKVSDPRMSHSGILRIARRKFAMNNDRELQTALPPSAPQTPIAVHEMNCRETKNGATPVTVTGTVTDS
jgi:hypothetical protein